MKTEEMDTVCIFTLMELNMRVIGLKINNMVMAEKCGPMEVFMKDNMKIVKKKEKANIFGVMVRLMKDNLVIIIYTVIFNINNINKY